MDLRSQCFGKEFDILSTSLSVELQEQGVILLRYEPDALKQLIDIVADPKTGKTRMGQTRFSELCKETAIEMGIPNPKFSQKTISNYINNVYTPNNEALEVMGKVLGVSFVSDWGREINNQATIDRLISIYS